MERYFGGRPEQFKRTCKIIDRLYTLRKQHNLTELEFENLYNIVAEVWINQLVKTPFLPAPKDTPIHLQEWVFVPCLRALASDEQLKQYLDKAMKYKVIGCYSQTELSHGSNVAGLGTTATFIKETDEFEFHTPYPEACKWWVGQLVHIASLRLKG